MRNICETNVLMRNGLDPGNEGTFEQIIPADDWLFQ